MASMHFASFGIRPTLPTQQNPTTKPPVTKRLGFGHTPAPPEASMSKLGQAVSGGAAVLVGGFGILAPLVNMASSFIRLIERDKNTALAAIDVLTMVAPRSLLELVHRGFDAFREAIFRESMGTWTNVYLDGQFNRLLGGVFNRVGFNTQHIHPKAWIDAPALHYMTQTYLNALETNTTTHEARKAFLRNLLGNMQATDQHLAQGAFMPLMNQAIDDPGLREAAKALVTQDFQAGRLSAQAIEDLVTYFEHKPFAHQGILPIEAELKSYQDTLKVQGVPEEAITKRLGKRRLELAEQSVKAEAPFVEGLMKHFEDHGLTGTVNILKDDQAVTLADRNLGDFLRKTKRFLEQYADRAMTQSLLAENLSQDAHLADHALSPSLKTRIGNMLAHGPESLFQFSLRSRKFLVALPLLLTVGFAVSVAFINNWLTQRANKGRIAFPGEVAAMGGRKALADNSYKPSMVSRSAAPQGVPENLAQNLPSATPLTQNTGSLFSPFAQQVFQPGFSGQSPSPHAKLSPSESLRSESPHFGAELPPLGSFIKHLDFHEFGESPLFHNMIIYTGAILSRIGAAIHRAFKSDLWQSRKKRPAPGITTPVSSAQPARKKKYVSFNEAREAAFRDGLGWVSWYFAMDIGLRAFMRLWPQKNTLMPTADMLLQARPVTEAKPNGLFARGMWHVRRALAGTSETKPAGFKGFLWEIQRLVSGSTTSSEQLLQRKAQAEQLILKAAKQQGLSAESDMVKQALAKVTAAFKNVIILRDLAQMIGLGFSFVVLGYGINKLNIWLTNRNVARKKAELEAQRAAVRARRAEEQARRAMEHLLQVQQQQEPMVYNPYYPYPVPASMVNNGLMSPSLNLSSGNFSYGYGYPTAATATGAFPVGFQSQY